MDITQAGGVSAVLREFEGADLGDVRLVRRLRQVAARLALTPLLSFPKTVRDDGELEGLYRWFANESFDAQDVLAPHHEQTRQRARNVGVVRIVHDTTDFAFKGDREDLGIIEGEVQGFFAHTALAVGGDNRREPLGVVGLDTYVNTQVRARRGMTVSQRTKLSRQTPREKKTSHRWEAAALKIARQLPSDVEAVHVMDQEADDFVVFATLIDEAVRFVIRGSQGRRIERKGASIEQMLASATQTVFRTVRLEHRGKTKPDARYRPRDERQAELHIRWTRLTIQRPEDAQTLTKSVTVNVVQVFEPRPPEGEQAVDWTLLTNEPVENLEQATAVVDHYRARWLIEEFFKALKTGCAVETRQLMSYGSLTKVVAIFIPIAWEMLRLRYLSRSEPDTSASTLFDADDMKLMRALLREYKPAFVLPEHPTVRDALLAIACLGGHLKRNGDPGWLTIGRGFDDFVRARRGWRLARQM